MSFRFKGGLLMDKFVQVVREILGISLVVVLFFPNLILRSLGLTGFFEISFIEVKSASVFDDIENNYIKINPTKKFGLIFKKRK